MNPNKLRPLSAAVLSSVALTAVAVLHSAKATGLPDQEGIGIAVCAHLAEIADTVDALYVDAPAVASRDLPLAELVTRLIATVQAAVTTYAAELKALQGSETGRALMDAVKQIQGLRA